MKKKNFIENVKNLSIEEKINEILKSPYIFSKFENICNSVTGKTEKFEVLLEIEYGFLKDLGFNDKGDFLNQCSKYGLTKEITYMHIKNAKLLNEKFEKEGIKNLQYSINISEEEMCSSDFNQKLKLVENKDFIKHIQFEILETIPNNFFKDIEKFKKLGYNDSDFDNRNDFISIVKSSALKINIDDVGSGFSNIEKIKILKNIFNEEKNKKFRAVKLDKEVILYNALYQGLVILNGKKNEEYEIINKFYKMLSKDITSVIKNMKKSIEEGSFKKREIYKNPEYLNLYKRLTKIYTGDKIKEFITNFETFSIEKQEEEIKNIMKIRMNLVVKETKPLIKYLNKEGNDLQLIREYREDSQIISNILERFGSINQLQGYRLFDVKTILQINSKGDVKNLSKTKDNDLFVFTENTTLKENIENQEKNSFLVLEKSVEKLMSRIKKDFLYYKKLELKNFEVDNIFSKIIKEISIDENIKLKPKEYERKFKETLKEINESRNTIKSIINETKNTIETKNFNETNLYI